MNFTNKLNQYMTKANFGFYALRYTMLCVVAYLTNAVLQLPLGVCYIINMVGTFVVLPIVYEVLRRILVVRFLLLGEGKK